MVHLIPLSFFRVTKKMTSQYEMTQRKEKDDQKLVFLLIEFSLLSCSGQVISNQYILSTSFSYNMWSMHSFFNDIYSCRRKLDWFPTRLGCFQTIPSSPHWYRIEYIKLPKACLFSLPAYNYHFFLQVLFPQMKNEITLVSFSMIQLTDCMFLSCHVRVSE